MTVFGLLLAAGSSSRYREGQTGSKNKLFERLPDGREVWRAAYDVLATHPQIQAVGIVGEQSTLDRFEGCGAAFVMAGGSSRQESCRFGLAEAPDDSLVLVHDAARPFASADLVSRVIAGAAEFGAAIPAVPVTDTIKSVSDGRIQLTLDRSQLFRAQTPQAAKREVLLSALSGYSKATDEASALEAAGVPVRVVAGDEANVKITTVSDLPRNLAVPTVGFGFDIHAFSSDPDRRLILGGVVFDGHKGLEGHSDADVLLHALTDALLGSVGEGDIGQLFPNDDPRFKDAESILFLREAVARVTAGGGRIVSADLTLLAESPKLKDKREEIRQRISQELAIDTRRVNVKATTMEGLGAIGRNEGIAAMASVTVILQ